MVHLRWRYLKAQAYLGVVDWFSGIEENKYLIHLQVFLQSM